MRRLRCLYLCDDACFVLYLTSACHAQSDNHVSGLEGAVFPAGLKKLTLVSCLLLHAFVSRCVDVMCEAVAVCMVCDYECCGVVSDVSMSCAEIQPIQQP